MSADLQLWRRRLPSIHPLLIAGLLLVGGTSAQGREATDPPPAQKGDTIAWTKTVTAAFERAVKQKKPVMICINSQRVDGGRVEPAAKGLREVLYKDPRVVTKSRLFIPVLLTSEGSSDDYGELRLRFGVEGFITSPQHIFARPDHANGDKPLFRKEYWPYGKSEDGVKALIGMMDKALAAFGTGDGAPAVPDAPVDPVAGAPDSGDAPAAPEADSERKAWIDKLLEIVRSGEAASRREALRSLITNDKEGDCTGPIIALLPAVEKQLDVLNDVVRVLGRSGLEAAAEPIHAYLKHKDELVRGNAVVTLEYIGSKSSVGPLNARAKREKVEIIANHLYRALGRCGAGDTKVRTWPTSRRTPRRRGQSRSCSSRWARPVAVVAAVVGAR